MPLLSELKTWRGNQAAKEGVEPWRVLPNAALEEIVRVLPKTKDELISIKGIKEAKYRKYGAAILDIVTVSPGEGKANVGASLPDESRITNHESREGFDSSSLSFRASSRVEESRMTGSVPEGIPRQARDDKNDVTSDSGNPQSSIVNLRSDTLSVSAFLDGVNLELSGMAARVKGEVSSVDERERVVYFSLKDAEDGSTLSCLIFRSRYVISGIRLSVGDEVIVEGAPEIWKPMGKFSMKCSMIEYAGEGALKKAYDALLRKLEGEGLLAPERKREIPAFPYRIALLTSRDGAAIGDFMTNVGRHGYRIDLYPSSVEGARAVPELLAGVRFFNRTPERYDCLVVIRGGGSLESLQAFNNEMLVREIADSKIPVVAGIGHEKDITLSTLVADAMVSTPTAASRLVRQSWEEGAERVGVASHRLVSGMTDIASGSKERLGRIDTSLLGHFQGMKERIRGIVERFLGKREWVLAGIRSGGESVSALENGLKKGKNQVLSSLSERLSGLEKLLAQFDPSRALRLGYSLVRLSSGKLLRKSTDAKVGDRLDIRLSEGGVEAEVKEIFN